MPTTVHIPPALLKSVDRRAKALGISRNRFIVRAVQSGERRHRIAGICSILPFDLQQSDSHRQLILHLTIEVFRDHNWS
jgi:hypothetical protein